jgi:predicted transcriptional regulator
MLPSEMVILMAITINKSTGQKLLTSQMDITSEYIGYMFNSLVNRGYLKGHRSTGFQLTTTGREAVHNFIKKNNSKATDIVERLRLLGIEINTEQERKLCKLEHEAVSID